MTDQPHQESASTGYGEDVTGAAPLFVDEDAGSDRDLPESGAENAATRPPWKILVVDDDEDMHAVTRFVLSRLHFDGAGLELVDAYSGAQAVQILQEHDDFAVALVDVVMESERAGLDAVRAVRERLNNHLLRIVLRTGQPGMAPERQVIADYDINGYLEKNEVTADKLYSVLYTAIRSYRELKRLDDSSRGLRQVIDATTSAFHETTLTGFTSNALQRLAGLMRRGDDGVTASGLAIDVDSGSIGAGSGRFADKVGLPADGILGRETVAALLDDREGFSGCDGGPVVTARLKSSTGAHDLLYVERAAPADILERQLLDLYTGNLTVAYENLSLRGDTQSLLREAVHLMAEAVERRGNDMAFHVRRVAEGTRILCRGAGLGLKETADIALAATLHDIGTLKIPETVLNKAGSLTPDEWRAVRNHCWNGHDMLKAATRPVFRIAATIALSHHERWDGQGYPNGLSGETIPLVGRMVAIVDCFDAMLCKRPYREPWNSGDALAYLKNEKGRAFDPSLIDIFFDHVEAFTAIRQRLPDRVQS